jgi:hypothetical protein
LTAKRRRMDPKTKSLMLQYAPDAIHCLRRESGDWYHELEGFPGVLFDSSGFVRFETKADYKAHAMLVHGKTGDQLSIKGGISNLLGYQQFKS